MFGVWNSGSDGWAVGVMQKGQSEQSMYFIIFEAADFVALPPPAAVCACFTGL
jgi:hypothetical protein